jgi:hypothetical protein
MRLVHILLLALLATALAGCAAGTSPGSWRNELEHYVRTEGKDDPAILRDVTWPQSRRTFGTVGGDYPEQTQDVKGVLVSVEQVGQRRWIIFLVGTVNRLEVQDIHIEALNVENNKYTWRAGSSDPGALRRYNDYYTQLWKQRGNTSDPPAQYKTFPKEDDQFVVSQNGELRITHPASGAQWELSLPADQTAQR